MNTETQIVNPLDEFDLEELSLLETIDHVLNQGMVISGEIVISVANIDLIYIGMSLLLGSVDTIDRVLEGRQDKTAKER
jgi:gas vesicle structural protein